MLPERITGDPLRQDGRRRHRWAPGLEPGAKIGQHGRRTPPPIPG